MRNSRTDRRSERTRQALNAALVELMLVKRYDAITVQDIIDRANVGRSTFYAHYLDKEDLLVSGFHQVIDSLSEHVRRPTAAGDTPASLTHFFEHVQAHQALYHALSRGGGIDLLYQTGHDRLRHNIEQHLRELRPNGAAADAPLPLVADHMAGALLTLLKWWLAQDMPYPPARMDALYHRLVMPGVQEVLAG